MTRRPRTAKTKSGTTVTLNVCIAVDGGWISYVLHDTAGYAVEVFIPSK